jgi:hypothetical protein
MFAPSIADSPPVNDAEVDLNVNDEEEEEEETHSEAAIVPSPEDPAKEEHLSGDLERYKYCIPSISPSPPHQTFFNNQISLNEYYQLQLQKAVSSNHFGW